MDEPGIQVAYGSHALGTSPSFTRIDDVDGVKVVQGWTSHRGRQYITDRTEAGELTVRTMDRLGITDPTNTTSPLYPMNPNAPIRASLYNPFADNWKTVYAGLTQNCPQTIRFSGAPVNQGQIGALDLFSLLAIAEVPPGVSFLDWNGTTFNQTTRDDGDTDYAQQNVQDRIKGLLADAGVDAIFTDIFSGNVVCQFKVYGAGYKILPALQDAADSEWPGVANIFISKTGIVTFHGRLARFNAGPGNPYGIHTWKAGSKDVVTADPTYASIATLSLDKDIDKVYNNALFGPENIAAKDLAAQLAIDSGSIDQYGQRGITGLNLNTQGGTVANIDDPLTETRQYSDYWTGNYAAAQPRIQQLTFRPVNPIRPNAEDHWNMLCNIEIGHRVQVKTTHPGGGGFNDVLHFVEGISYDVQGDLAGRIPNVTMTLDLSSVEYYTTEPWADPH